MFTETDFLWRPLLEAAAQTVVGAIGGYVFTKSWSKIAESHRFDGAMDLWKRGINEQVASNEEHIIFDGLISPYTQLFPGDPMENAIRWNSLYSFQGKISNEEFQAMEFFAGSDAALRIGSLNGETLVGLYSRYGFVGEGIIGVVPTKLIRDVIPDFFHPSFYGVRARIYGRLALCPAQHGFVVQSLARKSGVDIGIENYKSIYYIQVSRILLEKNIHQKTASLLGSAWAVTEKDSDQYLVQYGYISEKNEILECNKKIINSQAWEKAQVFYDDITSPSSSFSFKKNFIL